MRTLWNMIAAVAVINLLALAGLGSWLVASERLDGDRARTVRELMTKTIPQEKAELEAAAKQAADATKAVEAAAKATRAPLSASEQLTARIEASELDRQRVAALRSQVDALQRALGDSQSVLASQRKQVEDERAELEKARADAAASVGQEQFQKTLNILTALKPAEARTMLNEILYGVAGVGGASGSGERFRAVDGGVGSGSVDGGGAEPSGDQRATPGKGQVLAYLDAMEERPRTKIISEFMKSNPRLAAELLESLRARGQVALDPGKSSS